MNESPSATQARLRRARVSAPVAMACFLVTYVAMLFTIPWFQPADEDSFASFGYFVGLLVLGVGLIAVVIPIVVFSLGRVLDASTRAWGTMRAALAFGGAGLALGLVLAALMAWGQEVSFATTVANVAVPAAVGGLATRLLLPVALAHRWVVVLAWVVAAFPVVSIVAVMTGLSPR